MLRRVPDQHVVVTCHTQAAWDVLQLTFSTLSGARVQDADAVHRKSNVAEEIMYCPARHEGWPIRVNQPSDSSTDQGSSSPLVRRDSSQASQKTSETQNGRTCLPRICKERCQWECLIVRGVEGFNIQRRRLKGGVLRVDLVCLEPEGDFRALKQALRCFYLRVLQSALSQ